MDKRPEDTVAFRETVYGPVPIDWDISPLRECAEIQTGVTKGRDRASADSVEVPYLRVANVQDGYLDLSEMKQIKIKRTEIGRYSLEQGDVVLTEGGDFDKLGRGFVWNGELPGCVHQNHIFAVRVHRDRLIPEFLAYLTQSPYSKRYFLSVAHKTTNLACINSTKLKAFPVLIPPLSEQRAIAHVLRTVRRAKEASEQRRSALAALQDSLLGHLMSGSARIEDLQMIEALGSE